MTEQTVGMTLEEMRRLADEAAEQAEVDMSETQSGGFSRLYPPGYAFARLVEYVEFGKHSEEFNGKPKPPALTFKLGFAIWGTPPGQKESYHNEDGSPGIIRTYDMRISNNEKAGSKLAFDKLNYKGKAKQFYQFLGEAFLIKIEQKARRDGKGMRNQIVLKETLPPFEPATGSPYKIDEAPADMYRLFIWNRPTKQGWDSLFIDGKTDDGKSKNFIQEKCLAAVDFEGSPLQRMLSGAGELPSPEQLAEKAPETPATPAAPTGGTTPEAPAAQSTPAAPETPAAPPAEAPAAPAAPVADAPVPPAPPVA
jgi:hypothetical protein